MIGVVLLGIRRAVVGAVYRTGRGKDQVLYRTTAAGFQEIQKTRQVAVQIGAGIVQRIAHTGLGRQADDRFRTVRGEKLLESVLVFQVVTVQREVASRFTHPPHPRFFELRVVVVIEVIQPDTLVTLL